jgi:hypothetical protein
MWILNKDMIKRHYLKSWFPIDAVSGLLIDSLDEMSGLIIDSLDEMSGLIIDSLDEVSGLLIDSLDEVSGLIIDSLDEASGLEAQELIQIYTITDYCLIASCTLDPNHHTIIYPLDTTRSPPSPMIASAS